MQCHKKRFLPGGAINEKGRSWTIPHSLHSFDLGKKYQADALLPSLPSYLVKKKVDCKVDMEMKVGFWNLPFEDGHRPETQKKTSHQ
jgi:hypothetical protein